MTKLKMLKDVYQPSETDITHDIRKYLTARGIWHYKNWGGPMSPKGISDLTGVYKGIPLHFEIKKAGGTLSLEQRIFLRDVNINDGLGIVLRSVDDAIEVIEELKHGKNLSFLREKFSD